MVNSLMGLMRDGVGIGGGGGDGVGGGGGGCGAGGLRVMMFSTGRVSALWPAGSEE